MSTFDTHATGDAMSGVPKAQWEPGPGVHNFVVTHTPGKPTILCGIEFPAWIQNGTFNSTRDTKFLHFPPFYYAELNFYSITLFACLGKTITLCCTEHTKPFILNPIFHTSIQSHTASIQWMICNFKNGSQVWSGSWSQLSCRSPAPRALRTAWSTIMPRWAPTKPPKNNKYTEDTIWWEPFYNDHL